MTEIATVDEARTRADRIRAGLDSVHYTRNDIIDAYQARDWETLGYDSWASYVEAEFVGATRLRLPREDRRELVSTLRNAGLSTRAIASATGASKGTVDNDIKAGAQNWAPDDGSDSRAQSATPGERAFPPVTGLDGKSYAASKPAVTDLISPGDVAELNGDASEPIDAEVVDDVPDAPSKQPQPASNSRRRPLSETARSIAVDGRKWANRVSNLLDDDRFGRNRDAVGDVIRAELAEVRRTVELASEAIDGAAHPPLDATS